jgi:hypothetical protein
LGKKGYEIKLRKMESEGNKIMQRSGQREGEEGSNN